MTRVLVVDDEPSIRQMVATLLSLEGFQVDTAADGRAALQRVLESPPDLVVSDMRMPHMTGSELLTAIRANPQLSKLRFVILAGLSDIDATSAQARSLADACISKPFTRESLLDTLRSVLV